MLEAPSGIALSNAVIPEISGIHKLEYESSEHVS